MSTFLRQQIAGIPAGVGLETMIDGLPVPGLYYSASRIRDNIDLLVELQQRDPRIAFAYAAKACSLRPVLAAVTSSELKLEVQSMHEMRQANRVGVRPDRVLWNGPRKSRSDIECMIASGATVIIDSVSESKDFVELFAGDQCQRDSQIGIRVMPSGIDGYYSAGAGKLGMTVDEAIDVIRSLSVAGKRPQVLQCHALARVSDLKVYGTFLEAVADVARSIHAATGHTFATVDFGGGFDARSQLEANGLSLADFVGLARDSLLDSEALGVERLCFEPGRFVVEDAAFALASVIRRKERDGRQWLIVDVSTNLLVPIALARFTLAPMARDDTMPTTVADGTCSPAGVIVSSCDYPRVEEGATIIVAGCGAYTTALMEPFLEPPSPVFWIENGVSHEVISARDAILATDLFQGFSSRFISRAPLSEGEQRVR